MTNSGETQSFADLGLAEPVAEVVAALGYEQPTGVQAGCIPPLLDGRDLIGQAQTGSGKTAAFALPILSRIATGGKKPQVLVLAPTRELAGQVATSFGSYGKKLKGMRVASIYGGASYDDQIRQLKRGAAVVVGTPGRIIDHLNRGTLDFSELKHIVLDEADEMLRIGFIDDVDKILEQCAEGAQVALFSATMPPPIKRIAQRYLTDPAEVVLKQQTVTASDVTQKAIVVGHRDKPAVISRLLEIEETDGVMIFTRTKAATVELTQHLQADGHQVAALNGDMSQPLRERCVADLKRGVIDVVVATDVAARGLDVPRISHVINADLPDDSEPYVHRIGRTGRAGRSGVAIALVAPAQRGLLKRIERATRQPMEMVDIPSTKAVNDSRLARLRKRVEQALDADVHPAMAELVAQVASEREVSGEEIALAMAHVMQGDRPLLLPDQDPLARRQKRDPRRERPHRDRGAEPVRAQRGDHPRGNAPERWARYRIAVGHQDGVKPGQIVGAIANEAGIEGAAIGRIALRDDHSIVELPDDLPRQVLTIIGRAFVAGRRLDIRPDHGEPSGPPVRRARRPGKPGHKGKAGKPKPRHRGR